MLLDTAREMSLQPFIPGMTKKKFGAFFLQNERLVNLPADVSPDEDPSTQSFQTFNCVHWKVELQALFGAFSNSVLEFSRVSADALLESLLRCGEGKTLKFSFDKVKFLVELRLFIG